jgi:hypothetical protein
LGFHGRMTDGAAQPPTTKGKDDTPLAPPVRSSLSAANRTSERSWRSWRPRLGGGARQPHCGTSGRSQGLARLCSRCPAGGSLIGCRSGRSDAPHAAERHTHRGRCGCPSFSRRSVTSAHRKHCGGSSLSQSAELDSGNCGLGRCGIRRGVCVSSAESNDATPATRGAGLATATP